MLGLSLSRRSVLPKNVLLSHYRGILAEPTEYGLLLAELKRYGSLFNGTGDRLEVEIFLI